MNEPIGRLKVSVEFYVNVYDLAHYEATSLEGAAGNLERWYLDGVADIHADLADADTDTIVVRHESVD